MRKEGLFFGCVGLSFTACVSLSDGSTADVDSGTVPIFVHELTASPGCYVSPPPPVTTDGVSDMMAAAQQMQEMNMTYNMQYVALIIRTMLADPTAPSWSLTLDSGNGAAAHIEVNIDVIDREAQASEFVVEVVSSSIGLGRADPEGSHLTLGEAAYAWTDHVWHVEQGGPMTSTSLLRGCDPATGVSFQSTPASGVTCWNSAGSFVSCNDVDFWPL
jgi:hypothetical protein